MAVVHDSRELYINTIHTNEAGKSVTEKLKFTGIDKSATESMMTNWCKGVEEVSSDTMVSRKYKDFFHFE